jgi:glycosyltransferase involved in cell wall biosynthesis
LKPSILWFRPIVVRRWCRRHDLNGIKRKLRARVKILHVIETLSPNYGGPSKSLEELARAQAEFGLDVEILTTNAEVPRGRYRKSGRATLPGSPVAVTYCDVQFQPLRYSAELARYLRKNGRQFDVIHTHGLYRFPQSYGAYYARKARVPLVMSTHGALDPYLYARSSQSVWLKRVYERFVDLPNLRGASAIHYTTEDERRRVSFLGLQTPSFIVPGGLDWAIYERLPARGGMRARYGIGDAPLALFLGRLHQKKGLDILIRAFDLVRRRNPEARLLIVGPDTGEYAAQIRIWLSERAMENCVTLTGAVGAADVYRAYVDADIFVLPSYTENFGTSVVEAMACGTAVVVSDQVNIHDEVSTAQAGLVTRCDDNEVAAALNTLLDDAERRRRCGEAGRRLVQERFTWPSIVRALHAEYAKVCNPR